MATAAAIRDALADRMQSWIDDGAPVTLTVAGRSVTYTSLQQLQEAHAYWSKRADQEAGRLPFKLVNVVSRGPA